MKIALGGEERLQRIRENMERFNPPPMMSQPDNDLRISICGFGPSIRSTLDGLSGDVVMTTSGSHDLLISKGIVPKFHVECDPRDYKVRILTKPHKDVTYLVNSQCHPAMFEHLRDYNVQVWHGFTDDDAENQIKLIDGLAPGTRVLAGGTNTGMRAIVVARELGFRSFDLHGFDCCYDGEIQWGGDHLNQRHRSVLIDVDGLTFETSDLMMQSTDDFFTTMRMLPGCRFAVHGDGLLETRLKMYLRDPEKALNWGWWKPINFHVRDAA